MSTEELVFNDAADGYPSPAATADVFGLMCEVPPDRDHASRLKVRYGRNKD